MSDLDIIADFDEVIDKETHLVSNFKKGAPTGNSILFTAEAILCFKNKTGRVPQFLVDAVMSCEIETGLYARTPRGHFYSMDQEEQDDYIGLGLISYLYSGTIAANILRYGRAHTYGPFSYFYATGVTPGWNAWFGRYFALITHLEWAAGERPNLLRRVAWFIAVAFCKTDQDGWILSNLMTVVAGHRSWFERLACRIRLWRFGRSPHKGSMREVYGDYFGWYHPISVYSD